MDDGFPYDNPCFVEALLLERDSLYRQTVVLKDQLSEYREVAFLKASYEKTIRERDIEISSLKQQMAVLLRKIWGKSSERFIKEDPLQRRIDFEGLEILSEEQVMAEEAKEEIEEYLKTRVVKKKKKQPVRMSLPEGLPRREEHIYPIGINLSSGAWVELPAEITEVLVHNPASFHVRRIVRHVYVLKDKTQEVDSEVVTPPLPSLPLPKSNADASLLAELMVNKYVNHLPFYRQIQMFKSLGVSIAASTVNDWFKGTADLLRPLYFRLKELVLSSNYIQVDETTIPVINNEKERAVKAYLWMVRSVTDGRVFFHYDRGSRAQKVALELLKDFQGALQTDGYDAYKIYENKRGVLPLGCWAHARRYAERALSEDNERATHVLGQIGMLYDVERMADDRGLDDYARAELRCRLAYPLLVVFEKWVCNEIPKVLRKGRMENALMYIYKNFHRLSRYHLEGYYKMDNNLAENSIRPIAVGRKNYLFCGNHSAAEDAAVIYSLFGCCKAVGTDYREWLTHVLNHIHDYDNDYSRDLAELLPDRWKSEDTLKTLNVSEVPLNVSEIFPKNSA